MLFSRLLRDCFLQGCFATALSLRLLRNGPLSKVALRPLSLGCSATALSYPGLLRDHSLVLGCFATTLLSWVASRPLSCPGLLRDRLSCPGLLRDHSFVLGCFATTLLSWVASRPTCPGLLRDHSFVLGCFATALSWVASRPLSSPGLLRDRSPVLGCFATALLSWVASRPLSCPGLLRDRSPVLGCFATALSSWVVSRPLSLQSGSATPLSKLHASQLRSYIYPITTQTTPTLSGPASLAPCFEAIYSLSWPLSSMIGLLPRWARTIVVNNFNSRSAGPAKFNTEIFISTSFPLV